MRIWWIHNARVYEGTSLEIVQEMQRMDFAKRTLPFPDYVHALLHDAEHWGFEISASGDTDEELAESILASMIASGLAKPC